MAEPGVIDTELKEKEKKNACHLQFISSCSLGTSGLPTCYPLTSKVSIPTTWLRMQKGKVLI